MSSTPLLHVDDLAMHFPVKGGLFSRSIKTVKAVDGVSFSLFEGQTLGLVGESGCGKSTLGKTILRLNKPTRGHIIFDGTDITGLSDSQMRPMRKHIQMVFQDPAESLNSRLSIGQIIAEPLEVQKIGNPLSRKEMVEKLLERVGMPRGAASRFSFEFSGGQRQRIGIARALALNPRLIVLDEPVSALDVSVQSQVLNLLLDLQEEYALSYLFIAHDLAVVKHISDIVAVMYLGKIVEMAPAITLYTQPRHAYTKALIAAIPHPDPQIPKEIVGLKGEIPSPIDPPEGSAFGHRMEHPLYEESKKLDLSLVEIAPKHWVSADPCCLSEEDYKKAESKRTLKDESFS